ncbi:hypothetical protein ACFX14_003571 [Malus domestica]
MSMNKIKKRKRKEERPATHPRNKYSENPPDFAHLASPALGLRLSRRSSQNRLDRLQRHLGTHLGPPPPRPPPQLVIFLIHICICLLGASLLGWSFVGSDVSDVALEWATDFVQSQTSRWVGAGLVLFASCQQVTFISCGCEEESLFHA